MPSINSTKASAFVSIFGEPSGSGGLRISEFDMFAPVTVGKDGTGHDVRFYSATSGSSFLWDESADSLVLTNASISLSDSTFSFGTLSSTSQTGVPLAAGGNTSVFDVFVDDNNTTLTGGVPFKAIRARAMMFKDQANGTTVAALWGQVKYASGVDIGPARTAAVEAYNEFMTTNIVKSGGIVAGLSSQTEISAGVLTVNSGGILAGIHSKLLGAGQLTQDSGGIATAIYIDEAVTTGQWGYGLYITAGAAAKAIRVGSLSSTTAGSGMKVDATNTRAVEIHADDADTARATGTQGRAIFGRLMIYKDNACEDWGIDGLSKVSAVAKTGNVSAGVVGRFESTGTCSLATGSGNTFVAGVMGRLGGGGGFTLAAGTWACGVLAFYNTTVTNDFTGEYTAAFMATASDLAGTGDWDYGLYIEDTAIGISTANINRLSEAGTFSTPCTWDGTDEFVEWHARCSSATANQEMVRIRVSPGVAQTTGVLTAVHGQAYGYTTGNVDVYGLMGGHFEAGFKENCELIASGSLVALRCKVEDLGFDITVTGKISSLQVAGQFSAGTTMNGEYSLIEFVHEGNIGADTIFKMGPSGGMFQETQYFMKTATGAGADVAALWLTATVLNQSNDSTAVGNNYALRVDINGTEGFIPIFIEKVN